MTEDAEAGLLWQHGDDELLAAIRDAERERRAVDARTLALLGEAENRGLATAKGYSSTRGLVCDLLSISRGEANRRLAVSGAVTGKRGIGGETAAPVLPTVGAALAEGAVSVEHVEVVEKFRASLPATVTGEAWEPAEKILADLARSVDPAALRRFADTQVRARLDPDGVLPKEPRQAQPVRRLELHRRVDGAGWGSFDLDSEPFSQLDALLSAMTAPKPTGTGQPDTRALDSRRGDALADILALAASHADRPAEGGDKPQLVVTTTLDDLRRGQRPALLGAHDLPITASAARRVACDARVIPAVLGSSSEVLDIGRATRTIPAAIRRAVVLRDGGCTFPSCDRPPAWTDCHHIRHWADGGPTSLDNLALLCNAHHRTMHHTGWDMRIAADGRPEFLPPGWLDPDRTPRRNPLHQRE
ncbi:MAG: DUF222 domain-containing protein [Nocardioidaceae bacterium]